MPKSTESTTKFKADITNFKAAMQEATRYIKLANSEFKNATAGMKNWSSSTDGVSKKIDQLTDVLEAQERQLEALEADYKKTVDEQGVASKGAVELQTKINNQKAAITGTKTELEKWNEKLDELEKEENQAKTPLEELTDSIDEQQKELEELKKAYKEEVFAGNKEKAKELAGEIEDLSSELKDNKDKMKELDDAADDLDVSMSDTSEGFTVMKGALASLVADGIRMAVSALKDMVTEIGNVGQEFDSAMSKVAAVSGATGEEYDLLRDKAKEMGSTTKFTASEAAEAFNYMAMAGWKTEDMLGGIEGILNLAAASGSDLATTSDIVTDALTAMGYSADDSGRLADVMAAASSNANTNVEMMGETFKYAAPLAGALGFSMEDTAVAIGLMANAGIKGSQAGTSLRSMLSRLAAPPKECATAMEELGVSLTDSEGNMKTLDQVMVDLRAAFSGLSETEQTAYAKHIAGQEAMSGLLAIVNSAPEDFDKLSAAVANSEGVAKSMADVMQNNLGGDMTKLSSQFEGVQLAIYEKFEPALRSGVSVLSALVDGLDWIVKHSTEVTAALAAIAAGVASYVVYTTALTVMTEGWKALTIVTKAQAAAQAVLNAVMSANPIGLVVAALAALTAAFVVLWNNSEGFRNFFIEMWAAIKETVSSYIDAIVGFFNKIVDFFKQNWKTILLFIINPFAGFFKYAYDHFEGFRKFVDKIVGAIKGFFSNLGKKITEFFTNAINKVKAIWAAVSTWFNQYVIQPIMAVFTPIVEWFSQLFGSIYNTITSTFQVIQQLAQGCVNFIIAVWGVITDWVSENIITPIMTFFTNLWNTITGAATAAWETIKLVWEVVSAWFDENIIQPVTEFFTGLWNTISGAASTAWETIKGVWKTVKTWFNTNIIQPVKGVFSGMWNGVKNGASDAWAGIKSVFSSVTTWFRDKFAAAWSAVKKVFSTGGKVFDGIKEGIVDTFKTVVNAIIKGINKVIAVPFNAINAILKKIKNVEVANIKPFSGLISTISVPEIPELAKGGVLKSARLVMAGEDGTEAIVPLEKNKQWIKKVVDEVMDQLDDLDFKINIDLNDPKNRVISGAGNSGSRSVQSGDKTQVINFTQNITSPKAVDRLTLYRQTNDMLFTAKVRLQNV